MDLWLERKKILIIKTVKIIVVILTMIMYYLFFKIVLLFIWYYLSSYDEKVLILKNELNSTFSLVQNIQESFKKKDKKHFQLLLDLNKKNKNIEKEQYKILNNLSKVVKSDIIAYWYYCNKINKEIIKNPKYQEISLNDFDLSWYNIFFRKKVENKLKELVKNQNKLINNIHDFYIKNCNQNSWFRTFVRKYFIQDLVPDVNKTN